MNDRPEQAIELRGLPLLRYIQRCKPVAERGEKRGLIFQDAEPGKAARKVAALGIAKVLAVLLLRLWMIRLWATRGKPS